MITEDDKFNEAYFKDMLSIDEKLEYAYWIDTLVEFDCSGLDTLTPEEVDYKMYRMYQCDINQS